MLLTEEQKQQDLFYEEYWQRECPSTLEYQIYMSVNSKHVDKDTLEEK